MPLAVYARAQTRTEPDSFAGIAVTVKDTTGHQVQVEDVQAWGPRGAAGGPGSPTGTTTFAKRDPGLYSVRIRSRQTDRQWIYAATLRAGFLDTVVVTVGVPCTIVLARRSLTVWPRIAGATDGLWKRRLRRRILLAGVRPRYIDSSEEAP